MIEPAMPEPSTIPNRPAAIFLDRDGTINEDVGYAAHPNEISLYPYAGEAIRLINEAGLKTIVVTNQSGIARGFLNETMLERIHDHLRGELARQGARLDAFYYCPHHPRIGPQPYQKVCRCRKPQTGMLELAAREHGIDLAASYVIGDKVSDINLAVNAGSRGVLVKTGYGEMTLRRVQEARSQKPEGAEQKPRSENPGRRAAAPPPSAVPHPVCTPHLVAEDLLEAVHLILAEIRADERR
jgi:D-glycero-D-manno-heptose 1,7-bisphosphate phosphatase